MAGLKRPHRSNEGNMRKLIFAAAVFAAMVGGAGLAKAQTYPSRPIMMIVPLATGGSTDTIGRIMAEGMRGFLGQPVIVENVTRAGGSIGVGRGAPSPPHAPPIPIPPRRTTTPNT